MHAALLFFGIIVTGILTLLGIIFSAISFAFGKSSRFIWLAVFCASVFSLFGLVYYTTMKATSAAKDFTKNFQRSIVNNYGKNIGEDYHLADSLHSMQIQLLKAYEPSHLKANIPASFYNYLGYGDYFRLPLTYPYSIHSDNLLEGTLFNEKNVEVFSENDNGETDCGVNNISTFDFNQNVLLAEVIAEPGLEKSWLIYEFKSGKTRWYESKSKMEQTAIKEGFGKKVRMVSCENYFERLASEGMETE